jgi:hypothetical protein
MPNEYAEEGRLTLIAVTPRRRTIAAIKPSSSGTLTMFTEEANNSPAATSRQAINF